MNYFPESVDVPPMDPVIKQQWLKALRSGEYKQGRRVLRKKTVEGELKYCCLGVLCELHRKATGAREWDLSIEGYSYYGRAAYSPWEVRVWAGDVFRNKLSFEGILAEANDKGADFPTIANWIEANL